MDGIGMGWGMDASKAEVGGERGGGWEKRGERRGSAQRPTDDRGERKPGRVMLLYVYVCVRMCVCMYCVCERALAVDMELSRDGTKDRLCERILIFVLWPFLLVLQEMKISRL